MLIETQGQYFDRVRPFVPFGPDTARCEPVGRVAQRLRNLSNRLEQAARGDLP